MKDRPILFSEAMVEALLADIKTQTRRIVKHPTGLGAGDAPVSSPCPYGVAGDRLWVKEAFFAFGCWRTRFNPKLGRSEWHFIDLTAEREYRFTAPPKIAVGPRNEAAPAWWRRNALFMPRVASRITLEVTETRVERLQDITEGDAASEGMPRGAGEPGDRAGVQAYSQLWDSINGPGSWASNPWVWVVSFNSFSDAWPP